MNAGTALIRRPGPRLAEGIVTHIDRVPVDQHRAETQWKRYVEAMEGAGWHTVEVPPADDCPDAVFIEDAVVVYKNLAVITRPGADARKPEIVDVEKVVDDLGLSLNRIHPLGPLEALGSVTAATTPAASIARPASPRAWCRQ